MSVYTTFSSTPSTMMFTMNGTYFPPVAPFKPKCIWCGEDVREVASAVHNWAHADYAGGTSVKCINKEGRLLFVQPNIIEEYP